MEPRAGRSLSKTVSAAMGLASSQASQPVLCHEWSPNRNLGCYRHYAASLMRPCPGVAGAYQNNL